jgi:hypothetical protein
MIAVRILYRASLLVALLPLAACAPAARVPSWVSSLPRSWGPPSRDTGDAREPVLAEWRAARERLAAIRRDASTRRTLRVALSLREPLTGRTLEARGAVAIAAPTSLRMILLGPGGTTALDLWIDRDRYRFAVPAIDLLRRGDTSAEPASRRGLPIDFLRWWLLRPATGTLLWAAQRDGALRLLLRDGATIVDLRAEDGGRIEARRATFTTGHSAEPPRLLEEEFVVSDRIGCAQVRYFQASTGLEATVRCEGEDRAAQNPAAFADPDAAEGAKGGAP